MAISKKQIMEMNKKWKDFRLDEKIVPSSDKDVKAVAKALDKLPEKVAALVNKYRDLDADDLLDVIETGGRRYSLAIIAAMKGNRRALKQLDDLLGFL